MHTIWQILLGALAGLASIAGLLSLVDRVINIGLPASWASVALFLLATLICLWGVTHMSRLKRQPVDGRR